MRGRYLGWRLFIKGIRTELRQTYLGFAWKLVEPIVLALVFVFLREGKILQLHSDTAMSYGLFVMFGLLMFQTFFTTLLAPIGIFEEFGTLIKQIKVDPESLIIQKLLRTLYDALFRVIILAGLCIWTGESSISGFLYFIGVLLLMILFCLSLGLILAPINAIYRDIGNLVSNMSRPLLFISPIFYSATDESILYTINQFNPLAIFLTAIRDLIATSKLVDSTGLIVLLILALTLFVASTLFFRLSIPVLTDKISA